MAHDLPRPVPAAPTPTPTPTPGPASASAPTPGPAARHAPFPLTDTQQAYLLGRTGAFELGNVSTHAYYEFEGDLDLPRFRTAWERVVTRHDVLRLAIDPERGEQWIRPEVPPLPIETVDLRGADEETVRARLAAIRGAMSHRVLPADGPFLFGVVLSRLADDRTRVHVDFDALILDFLSWKLLLADLSAYYADPDAQLPPLETTFRDYVLAEAATRDSDEYRASRAYWTDRLPGLPPSPRLPLVRDPAELTRHTFTGRRHRMAAARWKRLKTRAAHAGLTPSGLAIAAFAEVLAHWGESARFTLNIPRMNRLPLLPQADRVLGEFASFSLLEVDHRTPGTFAERAARVQEQGWRDLAHQHVTGVELLRELVRHQGGFRQALMPVVLTSTIGLRGGDRPLLGGLLEEVYTISQTPQVYLDVQIDEHDGDLYVNWDAVDELFPAGLMDAMFAAFRDLLDRLEADEAAWDEPLPLRPDGIRKGAAGPERPVPDLLVQDLFARHAAEHPEHIAVIAPDATLSYGELADRARRVAHWLRREGAEPGRPVAVVMDRGWEQIAAAYGALFAGTPYVPLDPRQPAARLHGILRRTGARHLLTRSAEPAAHALPAELGIRVLPVDTGLDGLSAGPLPPAQGPDDLAYLLFTSGSTGEPKGAMIRHRGMVNALLATLDAFGIGPDDRALAVTALHHDMSTFDLFGVLGAGGSVVVPEPGRDRDPAHWAELVAAHGVTLWNSVPAAMEMLLEDARTAARPPASLRLVLLGGDWIPPHVPERLLRSLPGVRVVGVGGPTETTLWNIWHPVTEADTALPTIPYGRPIANTRYHLLNDGMRDVPDGVTGEMYCAGPGVAAGYWEDAERTAAAFVPHPVTGERLYRTGDLGRFRPDGTIEFAGRADSQVKIRGRRVELGEIEAALRAHPDVASAVAVAVPRPDGPGYRGLAAHATVRTGHPTPTVDEVLDLLRERLPEHMVPGSLRFTDRFPLTANGKVDRRALAAVEEEKPAEEKPGAPATALERVLAGIWQEVIGAPAVAPDDDFFALGGDSLLATRIVGRIRESLDIPDVTVRAVFAAPTVAGLAAELRAAEDDPARLEEVAGVWLEIEGLTPDEIASQL
ncbi:MULTISPECIES: non-ribosomal peptide synthetase [Streptomyces]|uniref:non-ribosomal peptide synthetase n=1 Tax=Streptomyces TaxID=1883 RepID=UPI00163C0208|nr:MULTISPECIES: non-ribosomal peptide synthetase [Streptomyces]MBC2875432.1 amino acid adenylation domain-containing protein [Streptomyces sp. TYQ1024]UBI35672.1 amino acid adenylation domain-containing protein [Streptomyces mobaraensis]UKW28266.1 non-ribosomal peptide synthetase [Streptomyces sp. TYQ1024]